MKNKPDWATIIIENIKTEEKRYAKYDDNGNIVGKYHHDLANVDIKYDTRIWKVVKGI